MENKMPTELYAQLVALRQELRERDKQAFGRTPVICSDESIAEMVRLMPQKASDFFSIPGVGPVFVEKYAADFLKVLGVEAAAPAPQKIGGTTVEETLRELSKKLININRNNRMLFLPKLAAKYAVDLYDPMERYDPLDLIFEGLDSLVVADISDQDLPRVDPAKERYRNLVNLIREANRELRDKGQNELYIGYPFVQGCLVGGDFGIRAPLCFFPVTLEHNTASVTVCADPTRDVIFNSTLILAHNKFNSITTPMPDCAVEEVDRDAFLQYVIDFYAENDIRIEHPTDPALEKFKEYPGESFPHYTRGALKLVPNIVIGKFPAYSNSIQRDFEEILDKGLVNKLVADLVSDYGETDFYSETNNQELEINHPKNKPLEISERNLTYINALNSAQETVLDAAEKMDELVIEGPPGTGKSQTITSLITQFVDKGRTVLMVSEKKTALDVVYSRLGNLSRYAMMLDDANNKNLFYGQLERLLYSTDTSAPIEVPVTDTIADEIDVEVRTLENIKDKLFSPGEFGIEPYKLYMENRRINLNSHEQIKAYKTIRSMMTPELFAIQYDEVAGIHKKFANSQLTDSLDLYQITVERYPWFLKMKDSLSNYDLILFSDAIDELMLKVDEWRNLSFFQRLFTKRRLKKDIIQGIKDYFPKAGAYAVRLIMEQPEAVKQSLKEYTQGFANLKPLVTALTHGETVYLTALRKIHKICGGTVTEWNDELYNTLIFEHIQRFEMDNRTLIPQVAAFDRIIDTIERGIKEKQKLTRDRIAGVLAENVKYITASKRKGEINRLIESRRRPSIAKFVKKFDFEIFKAVKIWLMTPEAVSEILPQQNGLFDLLIFDEASQLYIEKSIPSIIRAKKVVIAGDHKQLRPSSLGEGRFDLDPELYDEDTEISAALEEESLLDLARFRYPDVLLNTHYRSKYEELIDFSNYAFYKGRLFVAPNTDMPEKPPIEVHLVNDAIWEGRSNRREAERVVSLLREFLATRQNRETIGIITFNSAQRDMIYDVIDEECVKDPKFGTAVRQEMARKDNGEDTGFFVKNIESVQGDERDVIMFSIGYAKNRRGKLMHNFGWLNQKGGENRLNVAISRAKQKVHIVTSFRPAELSLDDAKNDGPKILKKYLEYAFAISDGNKEEAELILRSFGETFGIMPAAFETEYAQKVAEALRARGYEIDTQVGIGGYRIDIAVRKEGKYILGIECDGKLYKTSKSARERDYHRQKYLESRGWKIMRMWSMDWWRDADAQIDKICTLIDNL